MAKNKVSILVAKVTLSLGRDEKTGERNTLPGGEELTDELVKKFALAKKDIQSLIDDGKLVPIEVRAAAAGAGADSAALVAALADVEDLKEKLADADKDAEEADAHIDKLEKQVKDQAEKIEALTKDRDVAVNAGLAVNDTAKAAEARVTELETQIEKLNADLAEATKPPAADGKGATKV